LRKSDFNFTALQKATINPGLKDYSRESASMDGQLTERIIQETLFVVKRFSLSLLQCVGLTNDLLSARMVGNRQSSQ